MSSPDLSRKRPDQGNATEARRASDIGAYLFSLAQVMENAPLPFAICYPDGCLMNCNRAFSELTGYNKDELYRMPSLLQLSPPAYIDIESMAIQSMLKEDRPRFYEKELIRQDGSRVTVQSFLHYVTDAVGNPKFYYYFMTDVSDRYRMAKELDLERARSEVLSDKADRNAIELEAILSSVTEAVEVFNVSGMSMRANSAARACYGFDPAGMDIDQFFNKISFRYTDGQAVTPEDSPHMLVADGKPMATGRFLVKNADGEDIMILLSASPLIVKGKPCGVVCAWHDVTDRERLLEQLEKDRKMLQESRMQNELYFDLMSHDIININQIGMGYMELALDQISPDEPSLELLSRSLESFVNSSKLIDNVSKLKRIKSSDMRLEAVDIGKLLEEVVSESRPHDGRDVSIRYDCADGCLVQGNEFLKDVFSNIVGNSIKHSTGPLYVGISVTRAFVGGQAFFKVSIEDDGPGIPDELKSKVFIRFRKDMTRARRKGIGLYLVKSLAESIGGSTWVEDRVSGDYTKGSRFVIMLPAYTS